MNLVFQDVTKLALLALVPPLALLFRYATLKRRRAMVAFSGTHPTKSREQSVQAGRRNRAAVCYCLAALFLIVALARPAWKRIPAPAGGLGRDVLFLLDVSNSMLAEDMVPNRLTRARQAILDCVDGLQGDRVGLVIFAGSPSIVCPMTTDYGFFRRVLEQASPENVSQGGTRIGDAMRKSVDKVLDKNRKGLQDIILITDGGDQESRPEEAAKELEQWGAFLIVIGVGDERKGARIPLRDGSAMASREGFMTYKGREVWSRLESKPLSSMAKASRNGVFLNAGVRAFDLGDVYRRMVEHFQEQLRDDSESMLRYREEFQWFLGAALAALIFPMIVTGSERSRSRSRAPALVAAAAAARAGVLACGLGIVGALPVQGVGQEAEGRPPVPGQEQAPAPPGDAQAEPGTGAGADAGATERAAIVFSAEAYFRQGRRYYADENYAAAAEAFRAAMGSPAAGGTPLQALACYNLGNSYFRGAERIVSQDAELALTYFVLSGEAFRAALDYDANLADAAWNLELARRRQSELMEALKSDREGESSEAEDTEEGQQSQEGDPSEDSEEMEGEEDMEESDESGEGKPSNQSASDLALDLENQNMPPPILDPEDIFKEESMNNELRQKKGSSKYQGVEKDW